VSGNGNGGLSARVYVCFGRKVLPKKPTSADRWYTWSSEFYAFLALCSQNSDLLILSKKTKVYISLYSLGTVVIK